VAGRLNEASEETYRQAMGRVRLQAGQDMVHIFSNWLCFIGLIAIGSVGVLQGLITYPILVALSQLNNGLSFLFQTIGGGFTQVQTCVAGADRVFELMDIEKEVPGDLLGPDWPEGRPAIQLSDVCFAYEEDRAVLNHLTETVMPGEKIALIGSSGSGKSSVLKLLLGFYAAGSGAVRILGHELGPNPAACRAAVAYVPQTCYLFTGTIRENILAGKPGASDAEIERAARAALAHDFILALPQGYDTGVGERGAQLSGGQRQRIAIARAILKDAPILLLDEATASLDSEAESQVQAALEKLMEGRTVVVIAHRLSTVRNADRILVMEQGSIVERGTHEELLARDSLYARYVNAQRENLTI
jgi:ATP-binding cassette subfamily B protein